MPKSFAMAALLAASCAAQAAGSDADLAAIRAQIAEMKTSYEQRIAALENRLAEAESKAVQSVPAETSASIQSSASAFNPEVSLILQGKLRQAKDIANRGITGFFPSGVEGANPRGFSADETELVFAANVDPYWRGQAIVAMAELLPGAPQRDAATGPKSSRRK